VPRPSISTVTLNRVEHNPLGFPNRTVDHSAGGFDPIQGSQKVKNLGILIFLGDDEQNHL
jgi:hypothetical protein